MEALPVKFRLQLLLTILLLLHLMQLITARYLDLNLGNNARLATTKLSSKQTLENWLEKLNNKTKTLPEMKVDLNTMKFNPRFTLDSLPICGEGFKLMGNHCRREA